MFDLFWLFHLFLHHVTLTICGGAPRVGEISRFWMWGHCGQCLWSGTPWWWSSTEHTEPQALCSASIMTETGRESEGGRMESCLSLSPRVLTCISTSVRLTVGAVTHMAQWETSTQDAASSVDVDGLTKSSWPVMINWTFAELFSRSTVLLRKSLHRRCYVWPQQYN